MTNIPTTELRRLLCDLLRPACPTLRAVGRRRGTSYGYTWIKGSDRCAFSSEERAALDALGIPAGGNAAIVAPEDLGGLVQRLEKARS